MLVDQRNIGNLARFDHTGLDAEDLRRTHAHLFDKLPERQEFQS